MRWGKATHTEENKISNDKLKIPDNSVQITSSNTIIGNAKSEIIVYIDNLYQTNTYKKEKLVLALMMVSRLIQN